MPGVLEAPTHAASVSGVWKEKTRRLRGSGSSLLVNCVSAPVLSYRNGRGRWWAGRLSGRPVLYFSDWTSTPVSVDPSGLASTTPAAFWFT